MNPSSSDTAAIRFINVSKVFAAGDNDKAFTALKSVSLDVPRGSIQGVIGRSGAGKSTLVRLVNGLEKPTSGQVIVDGVDISALPERRLRVMRRPIGMIFQLFNLLSSRTVFDNIAFPLEISGAAKSAIRARVNELAELVGLTDKIDRYPAELSGGQKQRVGIARALANNPKILLSDEATSALDPETTQSILELLLRINRELGLTILLITHEMAVIRAIAQQVAVIDGGEIVERGSAFDVFTRPRHPLTRLFVSQETGQVLPSYFAAHMRGEPVAGGQAVVKIGFRGPNATTPVLARLAREHAIMPNIMSGTVDEVGGTPFGTLVIGISGGEEPLRRTLTFLTDLDLDAEVLGYVP
ncbi:MAG: methionine ABC transporter ATP-binding protein [Methylobacteriaceae bacterium]|jgi:D-methionine transport system ATP-binding protein|nr:methionine ABC transporter ATP-binding protein [Methylobacteriaceae bacterium]